MIKFSDDAVVSFDTDTGEVKITGGTVTVEGAAVEFVGERAVDSVSGDGEVGRTAWLYEHLKRDPVGDDSSAGKRTLVEIEIENGRYHFYRFVNGQIQESYAPVGAALASVYAACFIQGIDPPARVIRHTDCLK